MNALSITAPGGRKEPAQLGARIGRGGAKLIHELSSHPQLAAAIYLDPATGLPSADVPARHEARIAAMLARPPRLAGGLISGTHTTPQLAWPTHALHDAGRFVGYAMPRIPLQATSDLEALLTPRARAATGLPDSQLLRLLAARNLAALLHELHRQQHWVVDLKPLNVKVYRDAARAGTVALLDADGFSVAGAAGATRWPAALYSSEYISPEALRQPLPPARMDEWHDRWALAVIVFRLMNNGLHPYTGIASQAPQDSRPQTIDECVRAGLYPYGVQATRGIRPHPASLHRHFDAATRGLFDRAFGAARERRPSAAEWRAHLDARLATGSPLLTRCRRDPDHWHATGMPCGACALAAYLQGHAPPPGRGRPLAAPHPKAPGASAASPRAATRRPRRAARADAAPTPVAPPAPPSAPSTPAAPLARPGFTQRLRAAMVRATVPPMLHLAGRWPRVHRCLASAREGFMGQPWKRV